MDGRGICRFCHRMRESRYDVATAVVDAVLRIEILHRDDTAAVVAVIVNCNIASPKTDPPPIPIDDPVSVFVR